MKKILLLVMLTGCNGKFLWVPNSKSETKIENMPTNKLNSNINGVEFTFDDGPSLAYTPKILDILKKYNLRATFFVEGINLAGNSEQAIERRLLLKRIADEGHIIGNHTFDHKDLCHLSAEKAAWELDVTNKLIKEAINYDVTLVRPPYGKKCKMVDILFKRRGLTPVFWQIDVREWERDPKTHQYKTKEQVVMTTLEQYKKLKEQGIHKMIVILHDTKQLTVEALPMILEKLI